MMRRKQNLDSNAVKSDAIERRVAPRYKAKEDAAWVGWKVGEEFRTCHALILDVSLSGSSITADEVPEGDRCWLCLDGPTPTDWIEARVVGVVRTRIGPHQMRLEFENNCPYEFFKAAVYGFEFLTMRAAAAEEPEKTRHGNDWW